MDTHDEKNNEQLPHGATNSHAVASQPTAREPLGCDQVGVLGSTFTNAPVCDAEEAVAKLSEHCDAGRNCSHASAEFQTNASGKASNAVDAGAFWQEFDTCPENEAASKGDATVSEADAELEAFHSQTGTPLPFFNSDQSQQQLLQLLWSREPGLNHFVATLKGDVFRTEAVSSVDEALKLAAGYSANGFNVFFAPGEFKTPAGRKADNSAGARGFWLDIDCSEKKAKQGQGYATPESALSLLEEFCLKNTLPMPTHIVRSGGGLHVYWILKRLLDAATWMATARRLKDLTKSCGYLADQSKTSDLAALLRIPKTLNYKYQPPRPVRLLRAGSLLDASNFIERIEAAHGRLMPSTVPKSQQDGDARVQREIESEPADLSSVSMLVHQIRPDVGYDDWVRVLMGIFHETQGSEDGRRLAIEWSSRGRKFKGDADVMSHWHSFRLGVPNPVTIATLHAMARDMGEEFEAVVDDEVSLPLEAELVTQAPPLAAPDAPKQPGVVTVLSKYSLLGRADEVEQRMVQEVRILGSLALQGQATVFFAEANTGKTLITLHLLVDAIKRGLVDPKQVHYVNADDGGSSLLSKLHIADDYGFHTLVEGYQGFEAARFMNDLANMVDADEAKGVIVVLDTLTQFVDTMDKKASRNFTRAIRQFVVKGGTVIALAHVNKNPGRDGKPVFAGTSDVKDNFDCAYTVSCLTKQPQPGMRAIEFNNIKRRGNVARTAGYCYTSEDVSSYEELLVTVRELDLTDLLACQEAEKAVADSAIIEGVRACIAEGINQKMRLGDAVAERVGCSRKAVLMVISNYTGFDPERHHWCLARREARGAHFYRVLTASDARS